MKLFRIMASMTLMFGMCFSMYATPDAHGKKKEKKGDAGTTITLIESGTGNSKEEATNNALRSALEQTYGAFVSSNTEVINDELVKDEIVSISSGNIVEYEVLSFLDTNPKQVTVKAVISITKLTQYAQNKGMSAELAGASFAMNMKMDEMNQQNEKKALENLVRQIQLNSNQIFDYIIDVGNPQKYEPQGPGEAALMRKNGTKPNIVVPIKLKILASKNTLAFYDMVHNTLSSIAVNKKEGSLPGWRGGLVFPLLGDNRIGYELRSGDQNHDDIGVGILRAIEQAAFSCEVVDNIGNTSNFMIKNDYDRDYEDKCCYKTCLGVGYVIPTNKLETIQNGHSNPYSYRIYIKNKETYIDSWLGANKPSVGDVLFEVSLKMNYTQEEISKISKIEVRPQQHSSIGTDSSRTFVKSLYEKMEAVAKFIDIYNDEGKSSEDRINSIRSAFSLLQSIESTPGYDEVINPNVVKEYITRIKTVLDSLNQ